MLLARLENGLRFPVARNLRSPRKGKQSPSRNERPQSGIERADEIIVARKEEPPRRKSWERPQPCPKAGSRSRAIWPFCPVRRQRSSDDPTTFHHSYAATRRS